MSYTYMDVSMHRVDTETKVIESPDHQPLIVGEALSHYLPFEVSNFEIDGVDVTGMTIQVVWWNDQTKKEKTESVINLNHNEEDTFFTFGWVIKGEAAARPGNLYFYVKISDGQGYVWRTLDAKKKVVSSKIWEAENDGDNVPAEGSTVAEQLTALNTELSQLKTNIENIDPAVEVTVDNDGTILIGRGAGGSEGGNTTPSEPSDNNTPSQTVPIDTEMSDTSTNPVQNKVIKAYVDSKATGDEIGSSDKYTLLGTYTLTPNGDVTSCAKELDLEALGKTDYLINIDVSGKTTNATNLRIMDGGSISGASASAKDNPVRGTAQVSFVDGMCFGTACVDSGYTRNFASISGSPRLSAAQKKKVVVSFYPFVTETITATIKVYGRG